MSWLTRLNAESADEAARMLQTCCGSMRWARAVAAERPFEDEAALVAAADRHWGGVAEVDRLEAFSAHPRIGDVEVLKDRFNRLAHAEQGQVVHDSDETLAALAARNREYEARFGFIFIVCATGKSADEMLALIEARLGNDRETELDNAAAEQAKITRIRIAAACAA